MKKLLISSLVFLGCFISIRGQVYIGSAYYPEHVDSKQVEKDACLMKEACFNVARMGDFAWHNMEPENGKFTFEWLDHAVQILSQYGIQSLLCTPTAAIPKWMHDAHPEIMIMGADGKRKPYGRRRHACLNNEDYRQYSLRIAHKLAERYKNNKSIIGFQIDNELATEEPYCYCPKCLKKFQTWLKQKYHTIGNLNRAWGTIFWSETLNNFEQAWLPRKMDNPSAYLDYQQFYSDIALDFFRMQREAIKAVAPNMKVTTNIGGSGFVTTMDLYKLSDTSDVLSFDNYPVNVTLEHLYGNDTGHPFDPAMTSFAMQIIRGGKSRPIWVPEAQIGRTALTQKEIVKEGYPRLWNHQQLAYGCRLSVFFPFRSFESGHEHLMAGVIESDNVKRSKFRELQQTAQELQEIYIQTGEMLPVAKAAVIRDFQVDWAFENGYTFCPDLKYLREVYKYYHALRSQSVMTDVISSQANLTNYDLIVVPYLAMASPDFCKRLEAATQKGSTVILTCVSGIRNAQLHKADALVTTDLQQLAGIEVEGQEALFGRKSNILTYEQQTGCCQFWFDQIRLKTASKLASFSGNYFKGMPAITCNEYGKGKVYYVATVPEQSIVDKLITEAVYSSSIVPLARCKHPLVEISELEDTSGKQYIYIVNFSDEEQTIELSTYASDIKTEKKYTTSASVKAMDYLLMQINQ
ncbi:beta-galactosidase [Bacteroides stercorirosoris]|uniref:beta-galactosidase n=1 Tax=Bacteroides stercorirosoris TaxID=871324 RepID=UPI0023F61C14|nr:beta-galactosidase [Bacteroides stercorirosoris]